MRQSPLRSSLRRGAFHASAGTTIALLLLLAPRLTALIVVGALTAAYLALDIARLASPRLNRWFLTRFAPLLREKETAKLTGSSYFLLGSLMAALFPAPIAAAAVLFVSFGDPAATAVGLWRGRTRVRDRSLEGHLACLAACLIIALVLSGLGRLALGTTVAGAVAATLFESLPLPVNDNLTIPAGSALVMLLVSLA